MSFIKYTLFALLILLAACGGKQEDPAQESADSAVADGSPRMGGTLIRHLESECKSLNWVLTTTVYENYVLRYLYENLLDYDENMNIVPVLAESYEVSDDRINITVKLKDNLVWDDGTPITSNDVKFTIDKILDPSVPALNKSGWFSN